MSIINDALKKVQQGLRPNAPQTPASPSGTAPKGLWAEPPVPGSPSPANLQPSSSKKQGGVKPLLALLCAAVVIAGSVWYIYQEFHQQSPQELHLQLPNNIHQVQRLVNKSFNQLVHKEELPDFKTKKPEDLKPLAKITINAPTTTAPPPITAPTIMPTIAAADAAQPPVPGPVTLNVHGIMSNASGNLALINNQVYQEGDEVGGAKIVKISLDSITVNINGTEKTISVQN